MRFMVIVKANKDSEAGALPSQQLVDTMHAYNQELAKAGVLLAADGLHPSSKGKRVKFSGAQRTVTDGPFAETKELIAGFWILRTKTYDEVIDWVKRAPFDGGVEIEVRQVFEPEDFGRQVAESENRLRANLPSR